MSVRLILFWAHNLMDARWCFKQNRETHNTKTYLISPENSGVHQIVMKFCPCLAKALLPFRPKYTWAISNHPAARKFNPVIHFWTKETNFGRLFVVMGMCLSAILVVCRKSAFYSMKQQIHYNRKQCLNFATWAKKSYCPISSRWTNPH